MQPRIVFRTHYQVDEPAYMEFLIKLCTTPVQSTYAEVVAQRLAQEITSRGKKLNVAAGRYAVDLAKDLGLITDNHTWTDKGHLVDLIAEVNGSELEPQLNLTLPEKLLHFRIFIEADGAALLFIARRFIESTSVGNSDTTWNIFAKEMFVEIYTEYLAITNNTADRVALRRMIDRIRVEGYQGNSGSHKVFIHMQTLHRLGFLDSLTSRKYQLPAHLPGIQTGLEILCAQVPNILSLERVINEHKWMNVAVKVFQIDCVEFSDNTSMPNSVSILPLMVSIYQRIMSTGISLCSLLTLIEATQIEVIVRKSLFLNYDQAMNLIIVAQKEHLRDIRFHVDRRGQPAFVKLSDEIVATYLAQKGST